MISILLVDDHAIVREGYRALLAKQTDLQVLAEADSSAQAYQLYKELRPDVVITDISLPGSSGLALISRIRQRQADAKIMVFSMHQNPGFAAQAFRSGALGYISKSSPPEELLRAIGEVHAGRLVLSNDIAHALALEKIAGDSMALQTLTAKEFEILRLLVAGQSHDSIAQTLSISPKTVGNCHYLIKSKLGVGSDIELTRLAIKLNVLDLLELTTQSLSQGF
jgi:DNA-binding NarL/FixJ family response regulator